MEILTAIIGKLLFVFSFSIELETDEIDLISDSD
jgi:hypothetical protein